MHLHERRIVPLLPERKSRKILNVVALAVVAAGASYIATPAHAYDEGATCTVTIEKADGTKITMELEGDSCTRTADGNCSCTTDRT